MNEFEPRVVSRVTISCATCIDPPRRMRSLEIAPLYCSMHLFLSSRVPGTSKMSRSVCWLCYKVAAIHLKGVVRHMAAVHAHDPHFHICCGIGGCARTYSNFLSFKKQRHRDHLELNGPFTTTSGLEGTR